MSTTIETTNLKINKEQFTAWLNTAIHFSIWRWSNKKHIMEARNYISKKIGEKYRYSQEKAKDRDMLLVFLLNLWVGFCTGCPIQISLNSNKYSKNGVYGKVFFKYRRTKRILIALKRKGYLEQAKGYFTNEDKKETRIWGTEKLIKLFVEDFNFKPIGDVVTLKQESLIQLRKKLTKKIKDKKTGKYTTIKYSIPIKFEPTKTIYTMNENLENYNDMAKKHVVTIKLQEQDLITSSELVDGILQGLISGSIKLKNSEMIFKEPVKNKNYNKDSHTSELHDSKDSLELSVFSDISGLMISSISYSKYNYCTIQYDNDESVELINIEQLLPSITNTLHSQQWQFFQSESTLFLYLFYIKKLLNLLKIKGRDKKIRARKRKRLFNERKSLKEFGIKSLEFEINKKYLHRVFNGGSLDFDLGGRFYGSFYQGVSEKIRKKILINGNETTELDFSGMHIRMLYHDEELELKNDPYTIDDGVIRSKEEQDEIREMYKLVSLISINAKKQGAHIAVKDALEEGGFAVAEDLKAVQALMKNYQQAHEPIEKYLFSGVGLELQNKDSIIMERILMRLNKKGILGLPVHDSVIVEKQHYDYLYKIMMEEYKKVMGYDPELK